MLSNYPNLIETPYDHMTPNRIPINFTVMENDNSFVEVLCREYLTDYVALNFGMRGNGNRATVMQLFRFPEIDFSNMDDIIVLFFPSGIERFDFAQKSNNDHHTHLTVWPHWESSNLKGTQKDLWKGYAFECYSDYHTMYEYLDITNVLQTWCKLHKASLHICPAFHPNITKNSFLEIINSIYTELKELLPERQVLRRRDLKKLDAYPWEKHILLDGCSTMSAYANKLENGITTSGYWHYFDKGSPNKFWSRDAHPNAAVHRKVAELISELI